MSNPPTRLARVNERINMERHVPKPIATSCLIAADDTKVFRYRHEEKGMGGKGMGANEGANSFAPIPSLQFLRSNSFAPIPLPSNGVAGFA